MDTATAWAGMVNVHLLVPAAVNVIPVAVGVLALYPLFGEAVMVTVLPYVPTLLSSAAVPPAPALMETS